MKTVWSARAVISEFHLVRLKHHSAWLLSLRPNVLTVPDQVWFLSVLARMKRDQFSPDYHVIQTFLSMPECQ
jgi:hypothetical protein